MREIKYIDKQKKKHHTKALSNYKFTIKMNFANEHYEETIEVIAENEEEANKLAQKEQERLFSELIKRIEHDCK